MDCVNHSGVSATAYCQHCGKPLCTDCIASGVLRPASHGMILCNSCIDAWQATNPFVPPQPGVPNPSVAAVLGLIPGVGAMYNGQFVKGLIHVVIFAVLVSAAHLYGVFGLLIFGWIAYQSFEAYHTAKARRDGTPVPDPLGLNEAGSWLNMGVNVQPQPGQTQTPPAPGPSASQGPAPGSYQAPFTPPPYGGPFAPPAAGFTAPFVPPVPPVPPVPSGGWCGGRAPVGAIVLIGLGVLFLLGQLDFFSDRIFEYSWPVLLIGLGVWMIARRLGESHGGKG